LRVQSDVAFRFPPESKKAATVFMTKVTSKITWIAWGAIALTVIGIAFAFVRNEIQEKTVRPLLFPVGLPLADFTLTNQLGQSVSLRDLKGNVWIANIIFTRCAGPCPRLAGQMSELQAALPANKPIRLVTLTTDPDYDTPSVLKQYSQRFKADPARWWFLNGSKKQIADVAVAGLKLTAMEKEPGQREAPADLFIHSLLLVVVDKQGRLRGAVESSEEGWKQKVLAMTRYLLKENSP
jgi:cytochrome oxidase Cu insertion factor (SCO1/SenC/PrrC family)